MVRVVRIAGLALLSLLSLPESAFGQAASPLRRERPGFDFRKDGVWRVRARRVAEARKTLLARGRLAELNAPIVLGATGPSGTAVTGTLAVPFVLFAYSETDSLAFMRPPSDYTNLLFGASAPPGLPFSLNSFYSQLSNGLFGISGQVSPWARLASSEVTYTGTPSTACFNMRQDGSSNCNGIFSTQAITQLHAGLREALGMVDAGINFAQFDNDGADGIPNSGDDDGFVDLVLFGHPTQDGSCGGASNNHVWAHRYTLSATSTYTTNDARNGGGSIRVADYLMQSALGGGANPPCNTSQIMPIGVVAHELGHGLGLPDLYDIEGLAQGPSVGIGRWGLMGMGSEVTPSSPARMEAWSLNEMGWVALDTLTASGTYTMDPAPIFDTAFVVRVRGTNTRGEYFLLENRQASQADTALIRLMCARSANPAGCAGGLLIWHVDSAKLAPGRDVNHGPIHGLALKQADGFRNLEADEVQGNICPIGGQVVGCSDRGDAGDPYPGTANNTALVFRTTPAARKNLDGSFAGFAVDQVTRLSGGVMSFRLRFGDLTVVRASDPAALIQFEGANFNVFRDLLESGTDYEVSVADTQIPGTGRTRFRFSSWSDGGARTHTITGTPTGGDTITAILDRDFKLIATATAGGSITADTGGVSLGNVSAGVFLPEGRSVQLTATEDGAEPFAGWAGDTTSSNATITLPMGRPYTVTAVFGSFVIITAPARPNGVMGAPYADTLRVAGGSGTNTWSVTSGALPQGLTLNASTGVISGFPRQTGDFTFEVTVTSGAQSQTQTFTLSISAPALATADVVAHLLGPATPLTADQVRYLDFLGNNNTVFDIGDFLAWVKATGAP